MSLDIKSEIKRISLIEKAGDIGFLKAEIYDELRDVLKKRGKVSLTDDDIEKRINPYLIMPDAKSIIVCLFSYHARYKGNISSYAYGKDYHSVIKEKLIKISKPLADNGYKFKVFCDNGSLSDRFLAQKCGLGFVGKNGMLINKKLGSEFFIGYIITDCVMEEDKPLDEKVCIGCNKCISSCPGGAIGEYFDFNENLCVSYLTQKKGELTADEEKIIKKSGYIWGCDICNKVCPYNENAPYTDIDEFTKDTVYSLEIPDGISNKEFLKLYHDRAFSWRGKNVLIRNINLFKWVFMQNEYKTKKCFKYLNKIHKYKIKQKNVLHFYA